MALVKGEIIPQNKNLDGQHLPSYQKQLMT